MFSAFAKSFTVSDNAAEHIKRRARKIAASAVDEFVETIKSSPDVRKEMFDRIARTMNKEVEDYSTANNFGIFQIRKMNVLCQEAFHEEFDTILMAKRVAIGLPPRAGA